MTRFVLVCLGCLFGALASGQSAVTVFEGLPKIKISEGGTERVPEVVQRSQALNLTCVISKIGANYYWASRGNMLLKRTESGALTTFFAEDGSGYVRIVSDPKDRKLFQFTYVEHLLMMLNSVTYYGDPL